MGTITGFVRQVFSNEASSSWIMRGVNSWAPLHVLPGSVHLRGGSWFRNLERDHPKYLTGGHKYIIFLPGLTRGGLELLDH